MRARGRGASTMRRRASGSANHVDTEVFAALAGISLTHVPYRGTADGYRALLADEVQVMFGAVTSALPHVQAGKVRALAVLTDARSPVLPGGPDPRGSRACRRRRPQVARADGACRHAHRNRDPPQSRAGRAFCASREVRAWMDRQGLEVAGGTPSDFDRVLRADFVKWGETVRRLEVARPGSIDRAPAPGSSPSVPRAKESHAMTRHRLLVLSAGTQVGQNVLRTLAGRRDGVALVATSSVAHEPALFDFDAVYLAAATAADPGGIRAAGCSRSWSASASTSSSPAATTTCVFLSSLRDRRPDLAPPPALRQRRGAPRSSRTSGAATSSAGATGFRSRRR